MTIALLKKHIALVKQHQPVVSTNQMPKVNKYKITYSEVHNPG